jgi:hypothetical protein
VFPAVTAFAQAMERPVWWLATLFVSQPQTTRDFPHLPLINQPFH